MTTDNDKIGSDIDRVKQMNDAPPDKRVGVALSTAIPQASGKTNIAPGQEAEELVSKFDPVVSKQMRELEVLIEKLPLPPHMRRDIMRAVGNNVEVLKAVLAIATALTSSGSPEEQKKAAKELSSVVPDASSAVLDASSAEKIANDKKSGTGTTAENASGETESEKNDTTETIAMVAAVTDASGPAAAHKGSMGTYAAHGGPASAARAQSAGSAPSFVSGARKTMIEETTNVVSSNPSVEALTI